MFYIIIYFLFIQSSRGRRLAPGVGERAAVGIYGGAEFELVEVTPMSQGGARARGRGGGGVG